MGRWCLWEFLEGPSASSGEAEEHGGRGGERVVVRGQTTRAGRKMTFEKNLSQEAV